MYKLIINNVDGMLDYEIFEDYDGELEDLFRDEIENELTVLCTVTDEMITVYRNNTNKG